MPNIGIMDAASSFEIAGDVTYENKGNMTREGNRLQTIKPHRAEEKRPVPRDVDDIRAVGRADGGGEVEIQSMWSPAVTAVLVKGIPAPTPR